MGIHLASHIEVTLIAPVKVHHGHKYTSPFCFVAKVNRQYVVNLGQIPCNVVTTQTYV